MNSKKDNIADRLVSVAEENKLELSKEQALKYAKHFRSSSGELADDELDSVSGGGCSGDPRESEKGLTCPSCGGKLRWEYDDYGWTTASCRKCKKLYVYAPYGFIEVHID